MKELIQYFNWTFISVVHSAGPYGIHAEKSLRSRLKNTEICIAQSIELTDSMNSSSYDHVIDQLRHHGSARVVVLYADLKYIQVRSRFSLRRR